MPVLTEELKPAAALLAGLRQREPRLLLSENDQALTILPLQNCDRCDRAFRSAEHGLCRPCKGDVHDQGAEEPRPQEA
ncbi:hypothetical protein [Streptomyces sp. NPDC050848]|uniref:hypothetical protein n=1 Tax=Streptomyces sp. NPDC050848 TaxID=3155791 RepID=UPI0033E6978C